MEIRRKLYEIYWKIESFMVPTLRQRQSYHDILKDYVDSEVMWLDLGCGHRLLPPWRILEERELINNCKIIIGVDYDLESLEKHRSICYKIRGNASQLPFGHNSFDLITANMVVYHLANPITQFKEIYNILKPGGFFIFHTPNIFGYPTIIANIIPEMLKKRIAYLLDGHKDNDVFPTRYRANTKTEIKKLAKLIGFKINEIKMNTGSAVTAVIPPLVVIELLWIKMLEMRSFKKLRPNIIAILQKGKKLNV